MGVITTPNFYKALTFDGASSRTYGVYITGEGVFNAPERSVEMITIPGRNGAFALDQGHFENIEVTYPAGCFAETEAEFAEAISNFRNFLCSKSGYCVLTDDYNPGEYRLAIYKSGLEVDHNGLTAGEFEIVFECMPQRFLTSGETKTALTSGDTIVNPTLFPSKPLLEVSGYGNIDINGDSIEVLNNLVGEIKVYDRGFQALDNPTLIIEFDDTFANPGDSIKLPTTLAGYGAFVRQRYKCANNGWCWVEDDTGSLSYYGIMRSYQDGPQKENNPNYRQYFVIEYDFNRGLATPAQTEIELTYGTPVSATVSRQTEIRILNGTTSTFTMTGSFAYDGVKTITVSITNATPTGFILAPTDYIPGAYAPDIFLNSTKLQAGTKTYIDLNIGEAYKYENGVIYSANQAVRIPPEVPELPPGNNTITYDNTFSSVDITPRWWKV